MRISPQLLILGIALAPSDHATHFSVVARCWKRPISLKIFQNHLAEYEKATALSPHNYLFWLA
jgi:hypothetical protein